ncbi:hypothetical protein V1279_002497 [Bradyrhizobium sp. AZCC 1610]|uniref:hypothetical protein n=1 Tax=Bradyrhizobium sp. AZCC 1610 TaxID=3117020 RepID=UPI00305D2432
MIGAWCFATSTFSNEWRPADESTIWLSETGGTAGSGAQPFAALQTPLRRPEISFSQGAEWKALISKYIGTIPPTGDAFAAEQNVSSGPLPTTAVSSAMIAKVGAAASDSHLTMLRATASLSPSQLTAPVELL